MLFIENKYTQWYYRIIAQAQAAAQAADVYYEKHHIIPRSLGGSNKQDNLVRLTVRAHYVVHRLLTRMTTGDARHKMCFAIFLMTHTRKGIRISSHTYQVIREQAAKAVSVQNKGKPSPLLGTKKDKPSPLRGTKKDKPSPLLGKPSPLLGKPSPLLGTKKDKPSPLLGTKWDKPSPLLGKPSPNKGRPSPLLGKPSPLLGKPSPLKGRSLSAEHIAKILATKLQKKLDRPLD